MLIANDFYFKAVYHNSLTGKLSDIFGLVVFTLFLQFLFPDKIKKYVYAFVILFFCFWKSYWSSYLINEFNLAFPFYKINRVVDYFDLLCLMVLIPLWFLNVQEIKFRVSIFQKPARLMIIGFSVFAICATSRAKGPKFDGTIYVSEIVKLKTSKTEFLDLLNKDGVLYKDSSYYIFAKDTFKRYLLSNIVIGKDSFSSAVIGIHPERRKIEVYIEKIKLKDDFSYMCFDWKQFSEFTKKYRVEATNYFESKH